MITILPVLRSARLTQSPNSKCITKLTEEFVYRQLKRRRFTGGDAAKLAVCSRSREFFDHPHGSLLLFFNGTVFLAPG